MGEHKPPERHDCPFVEICMNSVTQEQYNSYCTEVTTYPKESNYMVCPVYQRLQTIPRQWRQRLQERIDDIGFGQSRTRGGHGV